MNKENLGFFPLGKMFAELAKQYLGIVAEKLEHTGIDRFFFALLVIKNENCDITQQRLSDILKTDKVTTVRVIDYLSKKGLVKRQVNKNDRREHLLILTAKAEKMIPTVRASYKKIEGKAFLGLSNKQINEFVACLHTVQNNLSKLPAKKMNIKFNKTKKLIK